MVYLLQPEKTGSPVLTTIVVEPAIAVIKDTASHQFIVKGYNQFGNQMTVSPQWSVIGRGSITSSGLYTPTTGSMCLETSFTIVAKANGLVSKATVVVEESKKLMKLNILPFSTPIKRIFIPVGTEFCFSYYAEDQFGTIFNGSITWLTNGGGTISQNGIFKATKIGEFLIFAQNGNTIDTAYISIRQFSEVNIALYKPVQTSSVAGDVSKGHYSVDGDANYTRWESVYGIDSQWISIDLKARYDLAKVILKWEAASAKSYEIQLSDDNINWRTVYYTNSSHGGLEVIPITGEGRYIRMFGIQRNTGYGYSLWEFEIYAKSMESNFARIDISPSNVVVNPLQQVVFNTKGFDNYGNQINISPIYTCNKGNITNNGEYSNNIPGTYRIYAKVGNITSRAAIVKVNKSPTLSILSPDNLTLFGENSDIILTALAYDNDGTINRVEFKERNTILATAYASLYIVTIHNLTKGIHVITAFAYNNDGGLSTDSVNIIVGTNNANQFSIANAGNDQIITLPTNSIVLKGFGTDSDGYIISYR